MSVSSLLAILTAVGSFVAVAAAVISAVLAYRLGLRLPYAQYELEQQRELRALMGRYTGRMLEAAVDWDRRMMQLYEYWDERENKKKKSRHGAREEDEDIGWHVMCPGWNEEDWSAEAVPRYRRDPKEYFYLSVVFRFVSLLAIARRFEAEAFYLDARHLENHADELKFLCYAKSFLWAVTHSDLSPRDGLPASDHFLSDKLRALLDQCYKDVGPAGDTAPQGQPIFDWGRFLNMLGPAEPDTEYDPEIERLLEFFDGLRPVDYRADDKGNVYKRRRWERLICLHLLTLNFIATFGFPWQQDIREKREKAITFLSMDNTVIDAFVKGSKKWLGLDGQDHMISLIGDLEDAAKQTKAIRDDDALIDIAVSRLVDMGAQKMPDPAVLQDKERTEFKVDRAWLRHVRWRIDDDDEAELSPTAMPRPAAEPAGA